MNLQNQWQPVQYSDTVALHQTTQQLHHAAQFIAMIGQSYLPPQDDDSHTNAEWLPQQNALAGDWVTGGKDTFRVAVSYPDFALQILLENDIVGGSFSLDGHTFEEAEAWLKGQVSALELEGSKLQRIQHYDLPDHPISNGAAFELKDKKHLQELANWRTNAHLLLQNFTEKFEHASPVRTWPHHFDTGSYIPVAFDEQGNATKSIGIGLAIADEGIKELYWYVNHFAKDLDIDYTKRPDIPNPGYWQGEEHLMAVLPASAVIEASQKQLDVSHYFFETGINASLALIREKAHQI